MWSGPRNLSTAMMRSFGNRPDTTAIDEPFYAAYLAATGIDHPMRDDILASQPNTPADVALDLASRTVTREAGTSVQYEKHMTHHMVPSMPRDWFNDATHVFLIRHPERVTASYAAKRDTVSLADLGFGQQVELFDQVCQQTGQVPAVIDSDDVLAAPHTILSALCALIDLPFDDSMLTWPAGRWPCDGVWGKHWYGAVEKSTAFAPASLSPELPTDDLRNISEAAMPHYKRLATYRIG